MSIRKRVKTVHVGDEREAESGNGKQIEENQCDNGVKEPCWGRLKEWAELCKWSTEDGGSEE